MPSDLRNALQTYLTSHQKGFGVFSTPVPGLVIGYADSQKLPDYAIYRPALGVVVQGAKQVWLGDSVLDYHEGEALLVSVSLLAKGIITRASAEQPFLGLSIELDVPMLREVAARMDVPADASPSSAGLSVHRLSPEVMDCLTRLARLLVEPTSLPILAPSIMQELSYWLLKGETGPDLRALVAPEGASSRIERALALLKQNFGADIRTEDLSAAAGMSLTSFHRHFKMLTQTTPLQYQKQLRLVEARRLLDAGAENVTGAAFAVGYESAAQFSRDYSRFYGVAPKRDTLDRRLHFAASH